MPGLLAQKLPRLQGPRNGRSCLTEKMVVPSKDAGVVQMGGWDICRVLWFG